MSIINQSLNLGSLLVLKKKLKFGNFDPLRIVIASLCKRLSGRMQIKDRKTTLSLFVKQCAKEFVC